MKNNRIVQGNPNETSLSSDILKDLAVQRGLGAGTPKRLKAIISHLTYNGPSDREAELNHIENLTNGDAIEAYVTWTPKDNGYDPHRSPRQMGPVIFGLLENYLEHQNLLNREDDEFSETGNLISPRGAFPYVRGEVPFFGRAATGLAPIVIQDD